MRLPKALYFRRRVDIKNIYGILIKNLYTLDFPAKQLNKGEEVNYTTNLFEAIVALVSDYRNSAIKAITEGDTVLYVPAGFDYQTFINLCANPYGICAGNNNQREPAYVSLDEALRGRNADGSCHQGFLVLDPIDREVVAVLNKDGEDLADTNESDAETIDGSWCGYSIALTDKVGKKHRLATKVGTRRLTAVTVIKKDNKFTAFVDESPIELDYELPVS